MRIARTVTAPTLTLTLGLFLLSSTAARPQAPAPAPNSPLFTLKPLGHNVWAAIDNAKGEAGANAGFVIGDNGVAVIDTFENPEAAKQLLAEIRKLTKLPIKYVVNTHYHIDHVAGNRIFQEAGAVVLAQRNVRTWIHTENLKFFGKDIKPEEKTKVAELGSPDIVYDVGTTLFLGSRSINVRVSPGHTGGDSVVLIPDATIVFCGDLFWRNTLPNLIDATTATWLSTLDAFVGLAATRPTATFVPGHGDVGTASDVKAFRGYLADLRELVATPTKAGKTGDALVNAVLPALTEKYGKWDFFQDFAKPDILDTAAELRGDKKILQPEVAISTVTIAP